MKNILLLLTAFVALTAIMGGLVMVIDPGGSSLHLSQYLLRNAPFSNYRVPGILLALVVGGINGTAMIYQLIKSSKGYTWTLAGASVLLVYIVVQILIIGEWNALQLFYLFTGGFTVLLTWQLKGKWAV